MAQARSPHYPVIGLDQAIEAAQKIHKKDLQNRVSREAVSRHLGYNSLNGRSLGMIGALRAYGLLEGSGDELRISREAVHIIAEPPGSSARQELIASLAFRPKLFSQLKEQFETKPSAEALRSALIKLGFTDKGIGRATKSFLDTYDLVIREGGEYSDNSVLPPDTESTDFSRQEEDPKYMSNNDKIQMREEVGRITPRSGMRQDVFSLDEGDLTIQWPAHLSEASFDMVKAYMSIILRKIEHSASGSNQDHDNDSGHPK